MFEHVQPCLRIVWIVTIHITLNLNKFRHLKIIQIVTIFIISSESEQVQTCLRIISNLENWVLWTFWELTLGAFYRAILDSILLSLVPEKKTAFLSGISFHFWQFVVRYGISTFSRMQIPIAGRLIFEWVLWHWLQET